MGGKRAKERRRLERQASRGGHTPTKALGGTNEGHTPDKKQQVQPRVDRKDQRQDGGGGRSPRSQFDRQRRPREQQQQQQHYQQQQQYHHRGRQAASSPKAAYKNKKKHNNAKHKTKEKKFKKPKHLKRKLEEAKGDEETRSKILQERKKLEELKKGSQGMMDYQPQYDTNTWVGREDDSNGIDSMDSPIEDSFPRTPQGTKQSTTENDQRVDTADPPPAAASASGATTGANSGAGTRKNEKTRSPSIVSEEDSSDEEEEDDDNDNDDDNNRTEPTKNDKAPESKAKSTSDNDDGDSSDDDDSDSDVDLDIPTKRQRGRKRKGREDTEAAVKATKGTPDTKGKTKTTGDASEAESESKPQYDKDNDTRRCKGRKPVTDFVIGQKYPGTVVYMKPFGVFFDIKCHSEAFCHVSRLTDGFVKRPEDVLQIGQEVSARVVDIDREQKRITVSLQSDARAEDELKSIESHKKNVERYTKRARLAGKMGPPGTSRGGANKTKSDGPDRRSFNQQGKSQTTAKTSKTEGNTDGADTSDSSRLVDADGNYLKPESEMTPAELKRARKLARRAQRRSQTNVDDS